MSLLWWVSAFAGLAPTAADVLHSDGQSVACGTRVAVVGDIDGDGLDDVAVVGVAIAAFLAGWSPPPASC